MQTADKRPGLFDPGAGRGSFRAARRAFYRHLTAWRVASATCSILVGFNEQHSVRIADEAVCRLHLSETDCMNRVACVLITIQFAYLWTDIQNNSQHDEAT
jgi:hypothetical protein